MRKESDGQFSWNDSIMFETDGVKLVLGLLTNEDLQILKGLIVGYDRYNIANELKISVEEVNRRAGVIYNRLQLGELDEFNGCENEFPSDNESQKDAEKRMSASSLWELVKGLPVSLFNEVSESVSTKLENCDFCAIGYIKAFMGKKTMLFDWSYGFSSFQAFEHFIKTNGASMFLTERVIH